MSVLNVVAYLFSIDPRWVNLDGRRFLRCEVRWQ